MKKWLGKALRGLLFLVVALLGSRLEAKSNVRGPVEFAVVIPSYNNVKWCERNLESVFSQTYPYWTIYYIDDCSQDGTGQKVEEYCASRGMRGKCTIIHNPSRKGAMANLCSTIRSIPSHKVVVTLDGDDRFAHEKVLDRLQQEYVNPDVWMTYGSYKTEPEGGVCLSEALPYKVMSRCSFRKYKWVTSHLRSFYAALFQLIRVEDFMFEGRFLEVTYDLAIMFPMLEMASRNHIRFISDVLYLYNTSNPIGDSVIRLKQQLAMDAYLRKKDPYKPLKRLFPK